MSESSADNPDLREACLAEALAIIAEKGVEKLSMREVSRRLGVSHQAPYKHFPSRDHILAEVVGRIFADFGAYLDAHADLDDADAALDAMGRAYLAYAQARPLEYRLMFGTPLPDPAAHPAMLASARHAFSLLREGLRRRAVARTGADPGDQADLDALYVWGTIHGLATMLESDALGTLDLDASVRGRMVEWAMARMGAGLDSDQH